MSEPSYDTIINHLFPKTVIFFEIALGGEEGANKRSFINFASNIKRI